MAFKQFKLDRSVTQSRGIFNKYIYETTDSISDVTGIDYFNSSRFALVDNDETNGMGWNGGVIECLCSDGYILGLIQKGKGLEIIMSSQELAKTAFGELQVAQMTPIIQITAQYGLRAEVEGVSIGGTVSAVDSKFVASTGTLPIGLAAIGSTRLATYRAGQGLLARLTAIFTAGVANSTQSAGLITSESSFSFGYNGVEFGIVHSKGGELEQWEFNFTTGAGGTESATITIDGNPYAVPLTAGSAAKAAYESAVSLNAQVPGYSFSSIEETLVALASIPDIGSGSFTFSSATAAATPVNIKNGIVPVETWVNKADWNVNPNININPQFGNVYQIQMQYLGFGGIKFYIENPETALFELVHTIRYANTSTFPSVSNPIFRVGWAARNTGNTTDIVVQGASAAIFIEGDVVADGASVGVSAEQAGITTTRTTILSLQNRRTFFGTANRAEIIARSLVLATDTTKIAKFELVLNPVIAGGEFLEFTSLGDEELGQVSISKATVTGGQVIAKYDVRSLSSFPVDIGLVTSRLQPGDIFAVVASVSSGSASEMSAALTWQDDL